MKHPNHDKGRTHNNQPTMTDQSQAAETDVNVIVKRYAVQGTAPGNAKPGIYGDFTSLPRDYRSMIELARSIERHRGDLPENLKNLTIEDLVAMDNAALEAYMKPADKPTDDKEPKT